MANQNTDLTFIVDSTQLTKAFKESSKFETQIKKLAKAESNGGITTKQYSDQVSKLATEFQKLNKGNIAARNSIFKYSKAVVKSSRENSEAAKRLAREQREAEKTAKAQEIALQRHARELENLRNKYDPAYRAASKFSTMLRELDYAHQQGAISGDIHAVAVDKLRREYAEFQQGTAGWSNQFVEGGKRAGKSLNKFGAYSQQFGYQMSDFVVQVQGGTSAFVAFGQQGAQLFGLISGPWGAALSIGAALVGAFGAAWVKSKDQVSGSAKDIETQIKSLDDSLNTFLKTQEALSQGLKLDELLSLNALKIAEDNLDSIKKSFSGFETGVISLRSMLTALAPFADQLGFGALDQIEDYEGLVTAAEKRIADLKDRYNTENVNNLKESARLRNQELTLLNLALTSGEDSLKYLKKKNEFELINLRLKLAQNAASGGVSPEEQRLIEEAIREATQRQRAEEQDQAIKLQKELALASFKARQEASQRYWQDEIQRMNAVIAEEEAEYKNLLDGIAKYQSKTSVDPLGTEEYIEDMAKMFLATQNLVDELSEGAKEVLRLADVDLSKGISDAAKEAATLAANLGISLAEALSLVNLTRTYSGRGSGGMPGGTQVLTGFDIQGAIDKFKKKTRKGSGSGRDKETASDFLAGLQRELDFKEELLGLSEKEREVTTEVYRLREQVLSKGYEISEERLESYVREKQALDERLKLEQDIQSSISNGLMDIITQTTSVEDAFKNMMFNILESIYQTKIADPLAEGILGLFMANGGAFSGGVQMYAKGDVFNSPTAFQHSGGLGVMGEAGPEAIMPLKRGNDGKLGVAVNGQGGASVVQVQLSPELIGHILSQAESQSVQVVNQAAGTIVKRSVSAVVEQRRKGGSMKAAFG